MFVLTGYDALVGLLEGSSDTTEANELSKALLNLFGPVLQRVKPSEILPHLVSTGCLRYVSQVLLLLQSMASWFFHAFLIGHYMSKWDEKLKSMKRMELLA